MENTPPKVKQCFSGLIGQETARNEAILKRKGIVVPLFQGKLIHE
jgi:hypothetical protein